MIHRAASYLCERCGSVNDSHSEIIQPDGDPPDVDPPGPGDISVCLKCSAVGIYRDDLSVRLANPEDTAEWPPELRQSVAQHQIACFQVMRTSKSQWN